MLMKDITPGRQVWFQESGVGEDGKTERRMCQGTVTGMDGKKVSIQMEGENDTRALHPFQCFATQDELKSEMKWDLYMDTFQDKLCSAAEKYMGKCTDFLKGYTKSVIPQGQELLASEAGNKLRLAGSRFRESVSSFADRFTGQAQEHTMSLMDRAAHHVMLHNDLSQFEPGHFQQCISEGFAEAVENIGKNGRHEPLKGKRQRNCAVSFASSGMGDAIAKMHGFRYNERKNQKEILSCRK